MSGCVKAERHTHLARPAAAEEPFLATTSGSNSGSSVDTVGGCCGGGVGCYEWAWCIKRGCIIRGLVASGRGVLREDVVCDGVLRKGTL